MVDALLDTAIIIDLLREYEPAAEWIASQDQAFGVTKFARMEIIEGCINNQGLRRALRILKPFEIIPIAVQDIDWVHDKLAEFRLSHNVDPFDCLIAATPFRLQIPLYTRDLKHFTPLIGELAIQPY